MSVILFTFIAIKSEYKQHSQMMTLDEVKVPLKVHLQLKKSKAKAKAKVFYDVCIFFLFLLSLSINVERSQENICNHVI